MHFQRDFNKVSQQQFRGVCDQDCTAILLKVPSKWFLATVVGSARRVTRHMAQILAPHYAARIQSPPDFGQFPRTRLFIILALANASSIPSGRLKKKVLAEEHIFPSKTCLSAIFDRVNKKCIYCIKILIVSFNINV